MKARRLAILAGALAVTLSASDAAAAAPPQGAALTGLVRYLIGKGQ